MKILIAVPTFENIYPDTFRSIYGLDNGGHEVTFEFVRGYDCATARNRIAQRSLDLGTDFVLMVDNDVVLPKEALLQLLEGGKDVVLGWYPHRNNENRYTGGMSVCKLGWFNFPTESQFNVAELREFAARGEHKVEIHGGGMGCALIRTDVFRKLKYPWYDWVNYADEHRGMLSEDLYFCVQCKHAEIPIYTDSRVGCGHLFRYVQWPE